MHSRGEKILLLFSFALCSVLGLQSESLKPSETLTKPGLCREDFLLPLVTWGPAGSQLNGGGWQTASSPKPWLEQGAQNNVQGFEHLHRRRAHNISGRPGPVSYHPYSKKTSVSLYSDGISHVSGHACYLWSCLNHLIFEFLFISISKSYQALIH